MGAPTLAGLAAAISIAMRRIEVRELAFRLFNGDQRPVTVLWEKPCANWWAGAFAAGHTVSSDSPLEERRFDPLVPPVPLGPQA